MRNFIRHPADIPIKIVKGETKEQLHQSSRDISIGGLRCNFSEPLAIGTAVNIIFDLVDPILELSGQVVWCRPDSASFELGIEYRGESDVHRLRMVEQICHIEHYRKEIEQREGRILTGGEAAKEWIEKYAVDFPK